jgi:hypothetical protein
MQRKEFQRVEGLKVTERAWLRKTTGGHLTTLLMVDNAE